MLRVFENFEWEVPLSGDDGGGGRGKNDKIGDLGAAQALQICCPGIYRGWPPSPYPWHCTG